MIARFLKNLLINERKQALLSCGLMKALSIQLLLLSFHRCKRVERLKEGLDQFVKDIMSSQHNGTKNAIWWLKKIHQMKRHFENLLNMLIKSYNLDLIKIHMIKERLLCMIMQLNRCLTMRQILPQFSEIPDFR